MGCNEKKTHGFISPTLQPFLQHTALLLALGLDRSRVEAHLLCLQLSHRAEGSAAGLGPNVSGLAGTRALSWARDSEGKTQPYKEPPGSPFRPSNNPHTPTGFIKSNWGHLLPPPVGLGTGVISWRKQGVNICLLQALKGSSELGW